MDVEDSFFCGERERERLLCGLVGRERRGDGGEVGIRAAMHDLIDLSA
jgi:hypothetical protein